MANTPASWDNLAPRSTAYNPFAMPIPQSSDIEKALSMRNFILNSGVSPTEIEALSSAKKAGVDVVKVLADATPKDPRDVKIDNLTAEIEKLRDMVKSLTSTKGGIKNGDH